MLLTAWYKYLLACGEGSLSSPHPVEQASNDRAAPYWLEAAQLVEGGTHPMKLRELLPPSDNTPGAPSHSNQSELTTGKLPHHVLCRSLVTPLECTLQFALRLGPGHAHWLGPRERKNQYNLGLVPLQKLPEGSAEHLPAALGAPLRICPRGLLLRSGIATRQGRFEIRVYLPLDGPPSQTKSPIYPGPLVLTRQSLHLRPFSCRWCQFRHAEARSWI